MKEVKIVIESGYQFNNRFTEIIKGIIAVCTATSCSFHPLILTEIAPAQYTKEPILVVGASITWVTSTVEYLLNQEYHPLVVGFEFSHSACTFITQNHYLDARSLSLYCLKNEIGKCAFVGYNPDSYCDRFKYSGLLSAIQCTEHQLAAQDVYELYAGPTECIQNFLPNAPQYKYIFCSNDTVALILISMLPNPAAYDIISFGHLNMKNFCTIPFHSITPDYFNIGKVSAEIYHILSRYDIITCSTVYIQSHFNTSNNFHIAPTRPLDISTIERGPNRLPTEYTDCNTTITDLLNIALESCDAIDIKLLRGLQQNLTYEQIAEQIFMSTNSVKRRLNKFLTKAKLKNKKQFLETAKKFHLVF